MQRPSSQLIESSGGAIEFAVHGVGPPVIICHGSGGGYDQSLMIARLLNGYRGIAVSRAGYLRTPVETGSSPAKLADAYASPMDALQAEKAAILGLSAGGMSAAYFALQYPDRCSGLVLADAITKSPPISTLKIVQRINSMPDGVAWFVTRFAVHVALPLMIRDTETRSLMSVFFGNNPLSERRAGVQNDLDQVQAMDHFRWEDIWVPTLLLHGEKDRLIPLEYSREVASRIPQAELFIIKGGGHECLISHHRHVSPIIHSFLAKHMPK